MKRPVHFLLVVFVLAGFAIGMLPGTGISAEQKERFSPMGERDGGREIPWMLLSPAQKVVPSHGAPVSPSIPSPGDTLLWDDGSDWTWAYYFEAGNGWGVEFSAPYSPLRVMSLMIWFNEGWPDPGGDDLILAIFDDDGPEGTPGTVLFADTLMDVADLVFGGWNDIPLGASGVEVSDGTFYGVYFQAQDAPNCPSVAFDGGYEENHCWSYYNGGWSLNSFGGDMLLRARIERAGGDVHDVGMKAVLEPGKDYDPLVPITPRAVVKNYGTFPETFDVKCRILLGDSPLYDEAVSVSSLAPDTPAQVDFPSWNSEEGNVYKVQFTTVLAGDETPSNDMKTLLTKNYTRTRSAVLIEGGTGTWCYYCQYAALGLDTLHLAAGDSVAIAEYHYSDSFANPVSLERIDYYNIGAYPTVVFDGTTQLVGGSPGMYYAYRLQMESDFATKVPVDIILEGNYDEGWRQGFARVTIDAVNGIVAEDLRLFTLLTESHIAYEWFDLDSLQFIAREFFPDVTGIPLALEKGDSHVEVVNFQVSDEYVDSNCNIIVFLQDYESKEVLGALTSPLDELTVSVGGGDDVAGLPKSVTLSQNYPNPFNPRTRIQYSVPEGPAQEVQLSVYSVRGERMGTIVAGIMEPGLHSVVWDGRDAMGRELGSGVYFYRLVVGKEVKTAKMLLLR